MNSFIDQLVSEEIKRLSLKEKMTGALVKKEKRGTYQALEECSAAESVMTTELTEYIKSWFKTELTNGELRKSFLKELHQQINLELYKRGFLNIKL